MSVQASAVRRGVGIFLTLLFSLGLALGDVLITGRVLSNDGMPIRGAAVTSDSAPGVTLTDSAGVFRVSLPTGRRILHVRALGFAPLDTVLDVAGGLRSVEIRMRRVAVLLDSVRIVESGTLKPARYANTMKFDDFYERKHSAIGGTFLTREDLERAGRADLPDLIRRIPGVRVEKNRLGNTTLRFERCVAPGFVTRGEEQRSAVVQVFVNGVKVQDAFATIDAMKTDDVEAIEVYQGVSQLPSVARGDGCAAIFLWTRYSVGSVLPARP